jgi:hypothetical protein
VAGDDHLDVEGGDGVEGRTRFGEGGVAAKELREYDAEAVFPERTLR